MPRPPICPPPKGAAEAFWKSKGKGWGKGSKFGVRKAKQDVKAKKMGEPMFFRRIENDKRRQRKEWAFYRKMNKQACGESENDPEAGDLVVVTGESEPEAGDEAEEVATTDPYLPVS